MPTLFDLAKETPALATEIRIPFPFKTGERGGYEVVKQESVPYLDKDGNALTLDDGQPRKRPRFSESDAELFLICSVVPAAQLEQARRRVKADCDKMGVPIEIERLNDEGKVYTTDSATASTLHQHEKAQLILEHVQGWEHFPKDGEPQDFNRDVLEMLVDDIRNKLGPDAVNGLIILAYTFAQMEEALKAMEARKAGRPTSGEASRSLAFAE